jgi:hypothetical protein
LKILNFENERLNVIFVGQIISNKSCQP